MRPFAVLKGLQLICGLVCYGLFLYYGPSMVGVSTSLTSQFVLHSFTLTCIVAYPFIIVLLSLLTVFIQGESSVETLLLSFFFNIVGFLMYLAVGIVILIAWTVVDVGVTVIAATAGMCIVTSLLFLCDIIVYIWVRVKSK